MAFTLPDLSYAHAALEMDEHPHYQINIVEGA